MSRPGPIAWEPIAVVGRGCALPGALDPDTLWERLRRGDDLTGRAPPDRWRLPPRFAMSTDPARSEDRAWSDVGGYVDGFDAAWDPTGFQVAPESFTGLDPVFTWTAHAARQAAREAGLDGPIARGGLVMGNLSFPSSEMARYAESVWVRAQRDGARLAERIGLGRPDPRNRFMSGLPAQLTAHALGLGLGGFALDAACASSLYALEIACGMLHDRRADVMVAGAVCRADDLFIHVGFCALSAMSRSGRSRPFHRDADGLVPAEGAAFVVIKRLSDAIAAGDRVLGVIRGIGLSNDGRGRGLLAPSEGGQERALRAAYAMSGLSPADVTLIEAHATGTPVGDATEIHSTAAVFAGCSDVPITSMKSNTGHLVTAAGAAGLLKLLGALRDGVRAPTLHVDDPTPALVGTPFRLVTAAEPWTGPRIAALSAFGFGGNNAHLLLTAADVTAPPVAPRAARAGVAITAIAVRSRAAATVDGLIDAVGGKSDTGPLDVVSVGLDGLRTPPRDLEVALAQQIAVLDAARELEPVLSGHAPARVGVWIGMGCDAEIARYGARWRAAFWAEAWGVDAKPVQEAFVGRLVAAGVLGTMPNIPANRISAQLDLGGPGHTVSAEEASGLVALEIAARAVGRGDLDAALVGAVDFSHEPVHRAALAALGAARAPGDAAVLLVIERTADAVARGATVIATLAEDATPATWSAGGAGEGRAIEAVFGAAHAASGLLAVAAAATAAAGVPQAVVVDVIGDQGQSSANRRRWSVLPVARPAAPRPPTGARLVRPAHAPEIRVSIDAAPQRMPPAPPLPPILALGSAPSAPAPAALLAPKPPTAAVAPAAPALPAAPVQPAAVLPAAPVQPAAVLQAAPVTYGAPRPQAPGFGVHAALAAAHQRFVADQAAVQQQFLALQSRLLSGLKAGPGQAPMLPAVAAPLAPRADRAAPVAAAPVAPSARIAAGPASAPAAIAAPTAPTAPAARPTKAAEDKRPVAVSGVVHPGPKVGRAGLEVLASGKISEVFGPAFANQDGYHVQCRMPEPPLLLADRLTGIDAEPHSMRTGTLWTETDVRADSWYLHEGRMPAGVHIESGQADLLLISWLGVDAILKGERRYRLLGCELTWHGSLPKVGDTLVYDIHVDGHANQGPIRLFFFHYDCCIDGAPRLTVRSGQAGFFTDEELASSGGVLWDAETGEHATDARLDAPRVALTRTAFDEAALDAFAAGRPWECFGPGWDRARAHVRTPRTQAGRMRFLHRVTELSARGGPWQRGYLRAEQDIHPNDWLFDGHFKNDPCMPGTLMFEGCVQAMALYLAAMGYTLDADGWRFEPVPEHTYLMRCRGQVTPKSQHLVYEVFVEELHDGPIPTLFADLLCTIDGLKAFHARRVGLRLVPDWPMDDWSHRAPHREQPTGVPVPLPMLGGLAGWKEPKPVATSPDGFPFDFRSLLACAWDRPTTAFGPMYARFDSERRVARLPGPPYHFMSRVTQVDGPMGGMKVGTSVEVEYDIPDEVWYFEQNGHPTMPFAVLMEAALQPCGWLASFVGSALQTDIDLMFRNLDGTGTLDAEILPGSGPLRTVAKITNLSRAGTMIIEGFEVACYQGSQRVYSMKTVFGFFPKEAFENQAGLVITDAEKARINAPSPLASPLGPEARAPGRAPLAGPMLLMLDRLTVADRTGGAKGKGWYRAEKTVDPSEWFFKAHFFQDPVQPGSLGVEALVQLLQVAMRDQGLDAGIENPRFEPVMIGRPCTWKYRGQVVPDNKVITTEIEITEVGRDERGVFAVADGALWVDGKRIYKLDGLGMRILAGPAPKRTDGEVILDADVTPWLGDHRPTFTKPALPMMSMVDRLAAMAGPAPLVIEDAAVARWLVIAGPTRTRVRAEGDRFVLEGWRQTKLAALSRFEPVASGRVRAGSPGPAPMPWAPLAGPVSPDPYASGELFHGPAFRYLTSLRRSELPNEPGASAILDAGRGTVPRGHLNQGVLDALTHAIPHESLWRWSADIPRDRVAYPWRIPQMRVFAPLPDHGEVRVEVRFLGFADDEKRLPRFALQAIVAGAVHIDLELVEILLPKGSIGLAHPEVRRAFLADRRFVPKLGLSRFDADATRCDAVTVAGSDWLPGTVAAVYRLGEAEEVVEGVAVRDHVAQRAWVHPSLVVPGGDGAVARVRPLRRHPLAITRGAEVTVRDAGPAIPDLSRVQAYWADFFKIGRWPVEDLYYGLIRKFVRDVVVVDPDASAAVHGKSVLYLANHQVGVESLLFSVIASALGGVPSVTVAKAEHRTSWLGTLIAHAFTWPGAWDPKVITFFERDDKESLFAIVAELAQDLARGDRSVMVHVEGTRSRQAHDPVTKMSGKFIDLALSVGVPIVPVRFVGGLPIAPAEARLEFPVGFGQQDLWFGAPIHPAELAALPYRDRKARVIDAINALGPGAREEPAPADPDFEARVAARVASTGCTVEDAVLGLVMGDEAAPCDATRRLTQAFEVGTLRIDGSPADAWLSWLATRCFGSRGPKIVQG